jgi:hypothetical protein
MHLLEGFLEGLALFLGLGTVAILAPIDQQGRWRKKLLQEGAYVRGGSFFLTPFIILISVVSRGTDDRSSRSDGWELTRLLCLVNLLSLLTINLAFNYFREHEKLILDFKGLQMQLHNATKSNESLLDLGMKKQGVEVETILKQAKNLSTEYDRLLNENKSLKLQLQDFDNLFGGAVKKSV